LAQPVWPCHDENSFFDVATFTALEFSVCLAEVRDPCFPVECARELAVNGACRIGVLAEVDGE